jgi:tyrosine aminotransferase
LRKTLEASPHAAGYVDACGLPIARYAIAKYHSSPYHKVHPDQVIVANGCSGALELALTALLDTDRILLVPQPGFPLYQVIAESHGASIVHYKLKEHSNWECDLDHMESLIQEHGDKITGVLINNPSNPTGTVFSLHHLEEIVSFCQDHQLPIIADEVYGDLTFDGYTFHPLAQVAARLGKFVPVITASGIGKQFLLPGWRVGWIVFQDK